jgi:ribosomal protein L17
MEGKMETLKLEPMGWIKNRHEIETREEKARAYSSYAEKLRISAKEAKEKRKEVLLTIVVATMTVLLAYGAMVSKFIIFG